MEENLDTILASEEFDLDLETPVSKEEANITGYFPEMQEGTYLDTDEAYSQMIDSSVKATPEELDKTNYDTDYPHVLIERNSLMKVLTQMSPIIGLNAQRAVSRGITLYFNSDNASEVDVISPNDLYYFKGTLLCTSTFEKDTHVYLGYDFISKISKFIPRKILIYRVTDEQGINRFFIRLKTGDLELLGPQLISADLAKLKPEFNLDKEIARLKPAPILKTLTAMLRILSFESNTEMREISIKNNYSTFSSSMIKARAKTDLIDIRLNIKTINYLIRAVQTLKDGSELRVFTVEDSGLLRYAFATDDTYMITNYAQPKDDVTLNAFFENVPALTKIDYSDLKYQLDYANSITYSMGTIIFTSSNGELIGEIPLQNVNSSKIKFNILSDLTIPEGSNFKLNTKSLSLALNSLDPSLDLFIGFKDGVVYMSNSVVNLVLFTY